MIYNQLVDNCSNGLAHKNDADNQWFIYVYQTVILLKLFTIFAQDMQRYGIYTILFLHPKLMIVVRYYKKTIVSMHQDLKLRLSDKNKKSKRNKTI